MRNRSRRICSLPELSDPQPSSYFSYLGGQFGHDMDRPALVFCHRLDRPPSPILGYVGTEGFLRRLTSCGSLLRVASYRGHLRREGCGSHLRLKPRPKPRLAGTPPLLFGFASSQGGANGLLSTPDAVGTRCHLKGSGEVAPCDRGDRCQRRAT